MKLSHRDCHILRYLVSAKAEGMFLRVFFLYKKDMKLYDTKLLNNFL